MVFSYRSSGIAGNGEVSGDPERSRELGRPRCGSERTSGERSECGLQRKYSEMEGAEGARKKEGEKKKRGIPDAGPLLLYR